MSGQSFDSEAAAVHHLLDTLPIYAVRIGYRAEDPDDPTADGRESTDQERALADALFTVHEKWLEVKPA